MQMNTAVLFLVFNRPDTTHQVFEAIRQARPPRLYVAADGPRVNKPGERALCDEARRVATDVDWPCEVKILFREENLGCRIGISSGINWFFEHEEEGIILEDDCLPAPSFFDFCETMLERYRNDSQVMMVAGTNFLLDKIDHSLVYYFSNLVSIWGWATWRRAWKLRHYDINYIDETRITARFNNKRFSKHFIKVLKNTLDGKVDTWDIQWGYTVIINGGLCITPINNQIKNIGYIGTHSDGLSSPFFDMATFHIDMASLTPSGPISVNLDFDERAIKNLVTFNKMPGNIIESLIFKAIKWLQYILDHFGRINNSQ